MKRILVVEDAHTLRKDIVEMLQFEGFEVDSAENGKDGLDLARTFKPDLIISDIMMPVMDGMRLLEEIRGDKEIATIPLIFLTARTDRVDMRQGMELGADDFVTKPFHAAELLATVHTQLKKQHVREQEAERRLEDLRGNIIIALPHELRTPLNAVLGFSELLQLDAETLSPERISDMAQHIHKAGKRIYALIDSYLLYAHLELMLTDPRRVAEARESTTVHPDRLIMISAQEMAEQHQRGDLVTVDLEPIDELAINDVFLKKMTDELIDNAFKFSPVDSPVSVTGRNTDPFYVITVEDKGFGMSADQITQIGAYMQFSRRILEQQGTGLGLVIVRRICDLHGGEFEIESEPGVITRVTLRLPKQPVP